MIRMEFYGYHVFSEEYGSLTPEQAVFLDMGLSLHWQRILGGDEDSKREVGRAKGMRHRKRF